MGRDACHLVSTDTPSSVPVFIHSVEDYPTNRCIVAVINFGSAQLTRTCH